MIGGPASLSLVCPRYAALRELHIPEDKDTAKTRTDKDNEDNTTKTLDSNKFSLSRAFCRTREDSEDAAGT
jgi:hypothetical protein